MDYFHHIGGSPYQNEDLYSFLLQQNYPIKVALGIDRKVESGIFTFGIYESHSLWPKVNEFIEVSKKNNLHLVNMVNTHFTETEIRQARWSWVGYVHEQGYALPKYSFGNYSYNIECEECNIHEQTNPFQIADDVKWGKKQFRTLISMAEIFTCPVVIKAFQEQGFTGYEVWDVLKYKTKQPLESIKQLYFTQICPFPVENVNELKEMVCPLCGRVRYAPHLRGTFQYRATDMESVQTDFMYMQEWIGNGGLSWREVLVSNRAVQFILDQKWQGITFKAIDLM